MIQDRALMFSVDQAITANAASTDFADFGSDRDLAPGGPKWLVLTSKTAPGGTSPTLTVAVQTDDNTSFSSAATLHTTAALTLALGARVVIPLPYANERYMRLNYTVGGTSPTFQIDAELTSQHPPAHLAYPDASIV